MGALQNALLLASAAEASQSNDNSNNGGSGPGVSSSRPPSVTAAPQPANQLGQVSSGAGRLNPDYSTNSQVPGSSIVNPHSVPDLQQQGASAGPDAPSAVRSGDQSSVNKADHQVIKVAASSQPSQGSGRRAQLQDNTAYAVQLGSGPPANPEVAAPVLWDMTSALIDASALATTQAALYQASKALWNQSSTDSSGSSSTSLPTDTPSPTAIDLPLTGSPVPLYVPATTPTALQQASAPTAAELDYSVDWQVLNSKHMPSRSGAATSLAPQQQQQQQQQAGIDDNKRREQRRLHSSLSTRLSQQQHHFSQPQPEHQQEHKTTPSTDDMKMAPSVHDMAGIAFSNPVKTYRTPINSMVPEEAHDSRMFGRRALSLSSNSSSIPESDKAVSWLGKTSHAADTSLVHDMSGMSFYSDPVGTDLAPFDSMMPVAIEQEEFDNDMDGRRMLLSTSSSRSPLLSTSSSRSPLLSTSSSRSPPLSTSSSRSPLLSTSSSRSPLRLLSSHSNYLADSPSVHDMAGITFSNPVSTYMTPINSMVPVARYEEQQDSRILGRRLTAPLHCSRSAAVPQKAANSHAQQEGATQKEGDNHIAFELTSNAPGGTSHSNVPGDTSHSNVPGDTSHSKVLNLLGVRNLLGSVATTTPYTRDLVALAALGVNPPAPVPLPAAAAAPPSQLQHWPLLNALLSKNHLLSASDGPPEDVPPGDVSTSSDYPDQHGLLGSDDSTGGVSSTDSHAVHPPGTSKPEGVNSAGASKFQAVHPPGTSSDSQAVHPPGTSSDSQAVHPPGTSSDSQAAGRQAPVSSLITPPATVKAAEGPSEISTSVKSEPPPPGVMMPIGRLLSGTGVTVGATGAGSTISLTPNDVPSQTAVPSQAPGSGSSAASTPYPQSPAAVNSGPPFNAAQYQEYLQYLQQQQQQQQPHSQSYEYSTPTSTAMAAVQPPVPSDFPNQQTQGVYTAAAPQSAQGSAPVTAAGILPPGAAAVNANTNAPDVQPGGAPASVQSTAGEGQQQGTSPNVQENTGPFLTALQNHFLPQAAPAPSAVVLVPVQNPVPQLAPQPQLAPRPVQQAGPSTPTIVGSGGIKVVTSNPISISNPISMVNPNIQGSKTVATNGGFLSALASAFSGPGGKK